MLRIVVAVHPLLVGRSCSNLLCNLRMDLEVPCTYCTYVAYRCCDAHALRIVVAARLICQMRSCGMGLQSAI